MSRRSRRPSPVILLLTVIAAVIFFVVDNYSPITPPPATAISLTSMPTTQPVSDPATEAQTTTAEPSLDQAIRQPSIASSIEPTRLQIPKAGINAQIIEAYIEGTSWDVSQLGRNVGHLQGTAWFGQGNNVVLSGHVEMSDGRGGVFANLDELTVDDSIRVIHNGEEKDYIIIEVRSTTPDDLSPIFPTDRERLTLITCGEYNFIRDLYLERTIIVAEPI